MVASQPPLEFQQPLAGTHLFVLIERERVTVTVKCPIQECFTLTLPGPTSRVHCANNETSRFSNIQREGEQGVNLLPAFNNLETPPPSPILSGKVNKGSIFYQRSITLKPPPPSPSSQRCHISSLLFNV